LVALPDEDDQADPRGRLSIDELTVMVTTFVTWPGC